MQVQSRVTANSRFEMTKFPPRTQKFLKIAVCQIHSFHRYTRHKNLSEQPAGSGRRRRHQAAAASHLVWSRSQSFAYDWVDATSHIKKAPSVIYAAAAAFVNVNV